MAQFRLPVGSRIGEWVSVGGFACRWVHVWVGVWVRVGVFARGWVRVWGGEWGWVGVADARGQRVPKKGGR